MLLLGKFLYIYVLFKDLCGYILQQTHFGSINVKVDVDLSSWIKFALAKSGAKDWESAF